MNSGYSEFLQEFHGLSRRFFLYFSKSFIMNSFLLFFRASGMLLQEFQQGYFQGFVQKLLQEFPKEFLSQNVSGVPVEFFVAFLQIGVLGVSSGIPPRVQRIPFLWQFSLKKISENNLRIEKFYGSFFFEIHSNICKRILSKISLCTSTAIDLEIPSSIFF